MLNLIVNADDLGISNAVNESILKATKFGIITSTSIIAGANSFDNAISISKELKNNIGIGVHLALTDNFNLGKKQNSIINSSGFFYPDIIKRIICYNVNKNELIEEYSMQIEKIYEKNLTITHLDHHHHLHRFKPVLDAVIYVAKKYNIRYIRSQKIINSELNILSNLYRDIHNYYLKRKCGTIDGYFSFKSNGLIEMKDELELLIKRNNLTIELVLHPGHEYYKDDLNFLISSEIKKILLTCNLINYGQI